MFKKTLLAVALAGVGASAQAAVVAQVATDYSRQALSAAAPADAVTTTFTVTLKAEYKNDDVVTIKFSSPFATAYTAPASIVATGAANKAIVTLGLLSKTADTVTYRVTDVAKSPTATSTIDTVLTLTDVQFTTGGLLGTKEITASYSAQTATGGFALDEGKDNSKKVLAAVDQFEVEVDQPFKGLITLPDRVALAGGAEALETLFTNDGATLRAPAAVFGSVKHTLEGDFSWIKDSNSSAGLQPHPDVVVLPATCALSATETTTSKLVVSCSTVAPLTVDFDIAENTLQAGVPVATATAANKAQILKSTKYTLTSDVVYTGPSGTFNALNKADAGQWTVDGTNVDVPYLAAGVLGEKTFSFVVNVTNKSNKAGNVFFDLYKEDGSVIVQNQSAGSVAPNAILRVGSEMNKKLTDFNGRFSAKVFVEVPAGEAEVYSAYVDTETSERAIVINTSNE